MQSSTPSTHTLYRSSFVPASIASRSSLMRETVHPSLGWTIAAFRTGQVFSPRSHATSLNAQHINRDWRYSQELKQASVPGIEVVCSLLLLFFGSLLFMIPKNHVLFVYMYFDSRRTLTLEQFPECRYMWTLNSWSEFYVSWLMPFIYIDYFVEYYFIAFSFHCIYCA